MSLTLGIGIKAADFENVGQLMRDLSSITSMFGYSVSYGVESSVPHVQPGLQTLVDAWSLSFIAIIHSPDGESTEAIGMSKDLIEGGDKAKALDFFSSICFNLRKNAKSFSIFFVVEDWTEKMRVRIKSGSSDEFIRYLSRPNGCGCWEELYSPKSNTITCDDVDPFVFTVS